MENFIDNNSLSSKQEDKIVKNISIEYLEEVLNEKIATIIDRNFDELSIKQRLDAISYARQLFFQG